MLFVVVLEDNGEIACSRGRVGFGHERHVVAFHRLHEALSHDVALRAASASKDYAMLSRTCATKTVTLLAGHNPLIVGALGSTAFGHAVYQSRYPSAALGTILVTAGYDASKAVINALAPLPTARAASSTRRFDVSANRATSRPTAQ